MTNPKDQAQSLFLNALEISIAGDRAAYVQEQCGEDRELRREVEELLDHARRLGQFLEPNGDAVDCTVAYALSEQPGTVIGPYKLLQQIGEGGMGVVFMAEQTQPIQRTVALKIIKPGMDTRQVIARFEAERQALALMDHPNIARVLDAGTTESGRPYFVMELVKGMPITKYCDDHHLPPRERLELFLPVCQAVQHAHQKGIIHRDLKPSNVMIALYDGHPIPKVIDFGVAKATGSKLTDRTMFTEFGAVLGTLEYMSPEQAELNQLDVDTRADVYSLGVLLYELLTGTTPLERKRMKAVALDEVLRVIREVEPPKPSTRLSTTEGLPSIAANRGMEPTKLSGLVRGELDWIVMKALEKDRNRRYETANGFASDVQRYLHDEAVQACPPSAAYRVRKFVRRNKAAVLIAMSLAALLITAVVILAVSNIQIRRALAEKDYAIVTASTAADSMLFRVAYDKLAGVPNAEALRISLMREAVDYYNTLLRQNPKSTYLRHQLGGVLNGLSSLHRGIGKYQDAIKFAEQSIEIQQQLASEYPHNPDLWEELAVEENGLAYVWQIAPPGPNDEQMKVHYKRAYDIALKVSTEWPDRIPPMTTSLRYFAESALKSGDRPKAEQFWRQAIEWGETVLNREPPKPLQSPFKSGLFPDDKFPHADRLEDGVYVSNLSVMMPHFERNGICWAMVGLGDLLMDEHRYDEAEAVLRNGMRHVDVLLAENSSLSTLLKQSPVIALEPTRNVAASMNHRLATLYSRTGKFDKAVPLYEQAVSGIESLCVDYPKSRGYWITARWFHEQFVTALISAGRKDQAKQVASQMHLWVNKIAPEVPSEPEARNELLQTQLQLVTLLRSTDQDREVIALLQQATQDCQSLCSEASPVIQLSTELATQIDRLASIGHEQEANDLARMAAEFGRRLLVPTSVTSEVPGESPKLRLLLSTLALLANNQQDTQQIEADRQSFRQAAEHYLDVTNSAAYSDRLAMATHFRLIGSRLAHTSNKDGQFADIHQNFMRFLRGVLKDSDCPRERRIEIGHVLRIWAYSLPFDAQHSAAVEEAFGEAVSVLESVTDQRPDDTEAWFALADTHNGLGHLRERIGGAAVAEQKYRRSVELFDEHAAIFDAHPISDSGRAECYFTFADLLAHTDRGPEAEPYYRRGVAIMESFVKLNASNPAGYNQLAWILATCPVQELRNPARATELAQRAVELAPASKHYWRTLGTARYREGDWNGAIKALNKSLELGSVNQAYVWFVLAMAHWQLHHHDEASSWRDKGVEWMEKNQAKSETIHRIRAEMEKLLKDESGAKNRESATTPN